MKKVWVLVIMALAPIVLGAIAVSAADPVDWTIMLYMDGDNDLEAWAITDFYELAEVGSTVDVNVVAQFDRAVGYANSDGDWTDCKRFYVTAGMTPTPGNALASLGETNMGDPQTLKDFVIWAIGQYPAEKYALVLRSHGWLTGVGADSSHAYDWLTSTELRTALQQVATATGTSLDVLAMQSCMSGSVEMAYQLSEVVEVLVVSEEVTSSLLGYPYDAILTELVADPTMNATEFAMVVFNQYVLLNAVHTDHFLTLSVLNTTRVAEEVFPAISSLATNLNGLLPAYCHEVLEIARQSATGFTNPTWRDIHDLCEILVARTSDAATATAAQNVLNALPSALLAEWHDINSPDLHGLSIYLPPDNHPDYYVPWYKASAFKWASDTVWDEFLKALFETYYPGTLARESFSEVTYTLLDSNADEYLDTIHVQVNATTTGPGCTVSLVGQLINSTGSVVATNATAWAISGSTGGWGALTLTVPSGSSEDWYDIALRLYDGYGLLEDTHDSPNYTALPRPMQHDVAVAGLSSRTRIVGQGFPVAINVSISNPGHYVETVNVTTRINGTIIHTTSLGLSPGTTVSFLAPWDTGAVALGNYTVSTSVDPVDGELNVDDNTLTGYSVLLTIPGDVDGNREVNIFDIVRMAGGYGTKPPNLKYDAACDIDGDRDIDIFDIVLAAGHYGDSW